MASTQLSAFELRAHPEFPHVIWNLEPSKKGFATVSRDRYGPCKIYYEVHGTGPKKLVMIMGLGGSISAWQILTKYFGHEHGSTYSVLVFDNRGVGKSCRPLLKYSTSQMAQDLKELLDHLDWKGERDLNIVGVSMGGMILQELACIIPTRINSMMLLSTTARMTWPKGFVDNFFRRLNLFIPRSIDSQLAYHKYFLCTEKWLSAPDSGYYVVAPFPTNGDRFAAVELSKKLSCTNSLIGFGLQALAANYHHKSPDQLARMADKVGRNRIVVVHGTSDEMLDFSMGVDLASDLGLITKWGASKAWSESGGPMSGGAEGGWAGPWGNWKILSDPDTSDLYNVKFVPDKGHILFVEDHHLIREWIEQMISKGNKLNNAINPGKRETPKI